METCGPMINFALSCRFHIRGKFVLDVLQAAQIRCEKAVISDICACFRGSVEIFEFQSLTPGLMVFGHVNINHIQNT